MSMLRIENVTKQFGGLAAGPEGLEYLIGATWVLSVDDRG